MPECGGETRVLIAGPARFSDALRRPLAGDDRFAVVGSASNVDEAVAMSSSLGPDVVLVARDLRRLVSRLRPAAAVIVLAHEESEQGQESESLAILGVLLALALLPKAENEALGLDLSMN